MKRFGPIASRVLASRRARGPWLWVPGSALAIFLAGCGPSASGDSQCVPGHEEFCSCEDGEIGRRICNDQGTDVGQCACTGLRIGEWGAQQCPEIALAAESGSQPRSAIDLNHLPATMEGSYSLSKALCLNAFAEVHEVTGDLSLVGDELMDAPALQIEKVGGDFTVMTSAPTAIALPELKTIGGNLTIRAYDLKELVLPALSEVGGSIDISWNQGLQRISMPSLQGAGALSIWDNDKLVEIQLPSLEAVGNLSLFSNDILPELSLPSLEQCTGNVTMWDHRMVEEVSLPRLTSVLGDLWFRIVGDGVDDEVAVDLTAVESIGGSLVAFSCQRLEVFSLPQLSSVGAMVIVTGNGSLRILDFPKLGFVGGNVEVTFNGVAQCLVDAFIEDILADGEVEGEVYSNANNDACVCDEAEGETAVSCP